MSESASPLVSIVMPAYNSAATIRQTIESALRQTLTDFELVVVDDGSTDATRTIVAEISDPRIRCHAFDNAGPSAARNRGIARSTAPFIAFLDADDLWLPGKLAAQVRALQDDPAAGLVYCWSDSIDEQDVFLKQGNYVYPETPAYEQLVMANYLDNGSTPMVRRAVLEEVGAFDEGLRIGEDWDLWLRIAHRYPIVCVPEALTLYRVRASSSSANIPRNAAASLQVLQSAVNRLPASAARDLLERRAKATQYQYYAMRLVESNAGPRAGLEAANYWWRYVCTTPDRLAELPRILLNGAAVLATIVLPPKYFRRLRQGWSRRRAAARS